ncbi:MAG: glutathione S-transferase family protein [Rhodospirillaceae bacterium]|jgi:glutathione S-transferase|nr:glutathione S-transferase family protein [Rhodospirillaceae bacterium]MBT3887043.1 glutathione S-transferase family protein [Rhodospirillaceae bacterium]MBT4115725.1 glutathione S-transferase family protein [Rhodospirillaceae bacterium]MBT4673380.1 glutathione S-transferase family protein [Rhodospirillaceae bacterium]MBT4719763.1 glutathione S-transferase family protein [Rhodospirillaceae bacterium]
MRTLYHLWLNPFSRKVRIVLAEKGLEFEMVVEQVWERRQAFLALNPAGEVPVLVEPDDTVLSDSQAICEFLDELQPEPSLLGRGLHERAEVRRLVTWFDRKFDFEVGDKLIGEKVMKRFLGLGEPDSGAIRAAQKNIHTHLQYITFLVERRHWLGGEELSLADITAAAHLSTVDYLGDVPWADHKPAKNWYTRIKSRPSMRPILAERIPRLPAAKHYSDLDF